jgi:polyhydroxyalkanoate synthesis regulator protein
MLSRDFLAQVIRSHAENAQGVLSSYLEQSIRRFRTERGEGERNGDGTVRPGP